MSVSIRAGIWCLKQVPAQGRNRVHGEARLLRKGVGNETSDLDWGNSHALDPLIHARAATDM